MFKSDVKTQQTNKTYKISPFYDFCMDRENNGFLIKINAVIANQCPLIFFNYLHTLLMGTIHNTSHDTHARYRIYDTDKTIQQKLES